LSEAQLLDSCSTLTAQTIELLIMEATKTREDRKVELEKLSATDQGRFELVELLNGYRGQSGGETLPSGTLAVTEILEYEFGPEK
jgi:hypothetical protein